MIKVLSVICLYLLLAIDGSSAQGNIIIINPATATRTSGTTRTTTPRPDSDFINTNVTYARLVVFKSLNLVAIGRASSEISVYDLNTRELVRTIEDYGNTYLAFKENQLIVASYGRIAFWNVETGELVRTIENVYPNINALVTNKRQTLLLTGGLGRNAILWDLVNFKQIRVFENVPRFVYSVAFDEDKNQVLAGHDNGNISIWNMHDGSRVRTLSAGSIYVHKLLVDEETGLLYSATQDGTIREWDTESGSVLRMFTDTGRELYDLVFSEDNQRLISAAKHNLISWSKQTGKVVTKLISATELYHLAINPLNGQLLTTSISHNGKLTFWSIKP